MSVLSALKSVLNNMASARDAFKIGWSMPPARTSDQWADYFHKTPMLDPVHMIAQDVASTPYKIFSKAAYRKDPKNAEPFESHPIYDLLDHPMPDHPEIDYFALMYLTVVYRELAPGEAFWLIDRDGRGNPCGIYLVPPTWTLLTPTKDNPYFRIQPMGNTSHRFFNADPADVVWFKSPNAVNPYGRGRGRTEALGDEIETHEYSAKYAKNFYYNDATPPFIAELPGADGPAIERFKEAWQQKLGGFLNAHKMAAVGQKDFKIHQLQTSPKEMDFIESRKYLIQTANEHFCVPPEMRGDLTNSNRATIDSAFYLWSKNVITRELRLIASTLNNQFVPMFDKDGLWQFDEIVPEDQEFKLKLMSQGVQLGTVTRNEWRLAMGLTADESGHGDVYLTQAMTVEVSALKTQPAKPEELPPEEDTDDEDGESPESPDKSLNFDLDAIVKELGAATSNMEHALGPAASSVEKAASKYKDNMAVAVADRPRFKSGLSKDARKAVWKTFDLKAASQEKGFKKAVAKAAADQQNRVLQSFKGHIGAGDSLSAAVDAALSEGFGDEADKALAKALTPAWLSSMGEGYKIAEQLIGKAKGLHGISRKDAGLGGDFDLFNNLFLQKIKAQGLDKAKGIDDTTKKRLRDSLSEGLEAGETGAQLKKRVIDEYDELAEDGARAATIARTESASSVNQGQLITYSGEGVGKKEWLSVQDDRTRDDHADADGQVVAIDEDFDVGGEALAYPGDPSASAENVCNCRCSMLPVVEDNE